MFCSAGELQFYYYYFLVHIPLTVFIDSSVVIPPLFSSLSQLVNWHIRSNNDFLLAEKPDWLYWFVVVELVFQLPLFFYFVKKLHSQDRNLVKWLKLYGWNASLTSLFCIWVIYQRGYDPVSEIPLGEYAKFKLIAYYTPTFLIPLRLCFL